MVTTSNRTHGAHLGDAFGNPNSIADVNGQPYIYASALDASFVDIISNPRVSFAMSQATLQDPDGTSNISACRIGAGPYSDPENPPCGRLVLSGIISQLAAGSPEEASAKAALFARHPSFKNYPSGHDFFVAKLAVDGIWLIAEYGGAISVDPVEYFKATPSLKGLAVPTTARLAAPLTSPPFPFFKAQTARWMAKNLNYGFLGTTSVRSFGSTVGQAFANPYSFADVNGAIYLYGTDLDASMVDAFVGNGSVAPNPRATLALSEASANQVIKSCKIGGFLGDPENPLCARLVLSGVLSKIADGSSEHTAALAALVARHPSFSNDPPDFYVAKLALDAIWLIDIFGGAADIKPSDYFKN